MSIFVFLQINNQYMLKDNEPASHGLVKIEQTPLRPDRQNCRVFDPAHAEIQTAPVVSPLPPGPDNRSTTFWSP